MKVTKKKIVFVLLTIGFLTILLSPQIILAADCTSADCALKGLDVTATNAGFGAGEKRDIPTIIGEAINYVFGIVGVIFLTIILVGGYLWMTAGGSEEKVGKAKSFIVNGINGIIVIFLAYALVYVMLFSMGGAIGSK
ncbi:MAG: hypothetical protein WC675_04260 [Patescibacteria group bacterium]|jgi:hypothetical protein